MSSVDLSTDALVRRINEKCSFELQNAGESEKIVQFEVESFTINCLKKWLIQHSDYFKVMLEGAFVESSLSKIPLQDVSARAFCLILELIFDERFIIQLEDILLVLPAASMLQFIAIRDWCANQLIEVLSPENCLEIWITTEPLSMEFISLKAKCLALIEFEQIRHSEYIQCLNLAELSKYLGNMNLECANELSVFQCALKWFYQQQNSELSTQNWNDTLVKLFSCIDFNSIGKNELLEIKTYPDLKNNAFIQSIFEGLYKVKNNENIAENSEFYIVKQLLFSKRRIPNVTPAFFLCSVQALDKPHLIGFVRDHLNRKRPFQYLTQTNTFNEKKYHIIYHESKNNSEKKLIDVCNSKCHQLDGYRIISYKELLFLFGGEFLIGRGQWNYNLWAYDVIREKWELKSRLPFPRRHFQACVAEQFLYIVGGTGLFRIIQNNMFFYNYKDNKFSNLIELPCEGRQIQCCTFDNKLFLLNLNNKCGYFFNQTNSTWSTVVIQCNIDCFDFHKLGEPFSLFCNQTKLCIKTEEFILELILINNALVEGSTITLPPLDIKADYIESILCDNILYTMYKYKSEQSETGANSEEEQETESNLVSIEKLDLDTLDRSFVLEEVCIGKTVINVNDEGILVDNIVNLFSFRHPMLLKDDKYVNPF